MNKQLLIVDDEKVNRDILSHALQGSYRIVTANDGRQAFDRLGEMAIDDVAAIILDLGMPVMDGYAFLEEKANQPALSGLPVVVTTSTGDPGSEMRALRLGAWDYVTKPYNIMILSARLENVISRSQMALFERIRVMAEIEPVTGLYNKTKFCEETHRLLQNNTGRFVLVLFSIDQFSIYRSFFGEKMGNVLLRHLGDGLLNALENNPQCTFGCMGDGQFALCVPFEGEEKLRAAISRMRDMLLGYRPDFKLVPSAGALVIDDPSMDVTAMLYKAEIAMQSAVGSYIHCCAFFEGEMQQQLEQQQRIMNEMTDALAQEEFKLYLQPKVNLQTGRPEGAEALVRWQHPQRGLVPPDEFIPVFEHNGFISTLDRYMWEHVCRALKAWADAGRKVYPVSVNISRIDLYNPHLAQELKELVDQYGVPAQQLNLEITESAFTDHAVALQPIVDQLHQYGFCVMMDDFGSGYSSLNVLKDVDVDVLKIDMKFLSGENNGKSLAIIESIVRMARETGLSVVAEGVETNEQASLLRFMGCDYAQGYLYARPIPQAEYEDKWMPKAD